MKAIRYGFLILLIAYLPQSWAEFTVVIEEPVTEEDKIGHSILTESGADYLISNFMQDSFKPIDTLALHFSAQMDQQDTGPYYDPEIQQITIPYTFFTEVMQRFEKSDYQKTGVSPKEATADAVLHTFLHELAHALIHIYDIPVLGKEEDAADGLANIMLIEYFEEGQEIAISAADLFDLESEDTIDVDENALAGEHSLDAQRFYTTLCHVYGSDPDQYASIPKDFGLNADRAELCIEEYELLSRSVDTLLADHLLPIVE